MMEVVGVSANDILILIFADCEGILPIYRGALSCGEGWPWMIKKRYKNALMISIYPTEIEKIKEINITGLLGRTVLSKLLSFFNLNWNVSVVSGKVDLLEEDVISMLIKGLEINASRGHEFFDLDTAEIAKKIMTVKTIEHAFEVLGISRDGTEFVAIDIL